MAVHELAGRKYATWEWNYGQNPASNIQHARRFPAGEIDARIDVQSGRITGIRLFGDFMGRFPVAEVERRLEGAAYERAAIAHALGDVNVRDYFGEVSLDDVLDVVCP
jgi:lipoate-protein ligase A